jgi:hypothetical protein
MAVSNEILQDIQTCAYTNTNSVYLKMRMLFFFELIDRLIIGDDGMVVAEDIIHQLKEALK